MCLLIFFSSENYVILKIANPRRLENALVEENRLKSRGALTILVRAIGCIAIKMEKI